MSMFMSMSMSVSMPRDLDANKNTDRKMETGRKIDKDMERDKGRTRTGTRIRMEATSADETRLSVSPEGYQVNEATNCILDRISLSNEATLLFNTL
jgi:hypothetical protein